MQYPQLVSNLTEDQDLAIAVIGESAEDTGLEFCQYIGNRASCENWTMGGDCSRDCLLWGSNDMGSPLFCTAHAFPQEQLGYEFVSMVAYVNRPVSTEFEITQNSNGKYFCTLVDYYQGTKPATRTQLPQVWDTYKQAHRYGFWYIEQSKLPISEGFSKASLEVALNA